MNPRLKREFFLRQVREVHDHMSGRSEGAALFGDVYEFTLRDILREWLEPQGMMVGHGIISRGRGDSSRQVDAFIAEREPKPPFHGGDHLFVISPETVRVAIEIKGYTDKKGGLETIRKNLGSVKGQSKGIQTYAFVVSGPSSKKSLAEMREEAIRGEEIDGLYALQHIPIDERIPVEGELGWEGFINRLEADLGLST